MPITEEELVARRVRTGSSDAHNHFPEHSEYGCERKLWYEKSGWKPDYPFIETGAMTRGTALEDAVADIYAKHTGRKLWRVKTRVNKKNPRQAANLDRLIVGEERGPAPLEIKVMGYHMFKKVLEEGLPLAYTIQLQAHMATNPDYKWGSYGILCPEPPVFWYPDGFIHFDVDRDDELIDDMLDRIEKFWVKVENGPAPYRLPPDDARCQKCPFRRTCQGQALLDRVDVNGELEESADLVPLVRQYAERKASVDAAKEQLNEASAEIKELIGDREGLRCDGYTVSYKPVISNRFNSTLFKKEHPQEYKNYLNEAVSRRFRVKEERG